MNINIKNDTEVYVLCPAYVKTGGTELLHQLVNELNKNRIESHITYFGINNENKEFTPPDFKKYISSYKTLNDLKDSENNIIITPEIVPALNHTKKFKNAKKIMWWMSVDNFTRDCGIINTIKTHGIINTFILMITGKMIYNLSYVKQMQGHLCQSKYSMEYLAKNDIINSAYLSDYISDEYLKITENLENKEDIILYNPKKGFDFAKKIIEKSPHLNFVPIENLTTIQVKELLLKSKVYIDFGNHPGKDRIPREAAMCGCCIITNKKGSAKYYDDVPINDEFKFEDKEENIENIIEKITICINNYESEIIKFENYKQFIKHEKEQFKNDVKKTFLK